MMPRSPSPGECTQSRRPTAGGVVAFTVLAVIFPALFFYVRSMAVPPTLSSALEGGRTWYIKPAVALGLEAVVLLLFGLFLARTIQAVVCFWRAAEGSEGGVAKPVATQRLRGLTAMRDQGLISDEEYEAKKAEILASL